MAEDLEQSEQTPAGDAAAEERDPQAALAQDLRAMAMILARTGRAWRWPMLLEGALWYLVTLGAVLLSAMLLAVLIPQALPAVTGWMLIIGAAAASVGAGVAWFNFRAGTKDIFQVARRLQREAPQFRNDIIAALEFGEKLLSAPPDRALGFSREMARAHVRRTTQKMLQKCEHSHLAHLLNRRDLTPPAMSLAGCVALLLIPLFFNSELTLEVLGSPFAGIETEKGPEISQRPIVGALNIYYSPPGYTGLRRSVDRQSSGYIEALVGTEIQIEATPLLKDAERIELILQTEGEEAEIADDTGSEEREEPAKQEGEPDSSSRERIFGMEEGTSPVDPFTNPFGGASTKTVRTSFVGLASGSYRFRAVLKDGTVVEEGAERTINLIEDERPELTTPGYSGDVEVSPDDVLDIDFEVSDDFGVESVWQVWHFAGDAENAKRTRVELPQLANTPRETSGEVEFDLQPLSLQSKDQVVFYFEATDNNSMTGPGVGRSEPIVFRVASPEDKHHQNLAAQQAILDAMVDLLADYLESPMGPRQVTRGDKWAQSPERGGDEGEFFERFKTLNALLAPQEQLASAMEEVARELKKDPLTVERNLTLFEALHTQIVELNEQGAETFSSAKRAARPPALPFSAARKVAQYASGAEDSLERGIFRLSELLASAKMAAVQASVQEINELKERLKELLEQYKETRDPELKKAILRDIQRLRQRMNELLSRMRDQLQELPKEHVNLDAIKQQQMESDTFKMADSLSQIEELLADDDIDGALKALEDLETSLDSLGEDMDEEFERAQPEGLSELDKEVSGLMDDLNDIQQAEKQLEEETNSLNKEMSEKRRDYIDRMLESFTQEMLKKVKTQQDALEKMDRQAEEIPHKQRINAHQEALDGLEKMLKDKDIATSLERAREALRAAQDTRYSLELSRRYSDLADQKRQLDQLKSQNEQVTRRGEQIVRDIEEMMEQAERQLGDMDRGQMEQLAQRQQEIAEQTGRLEQKIEEASEQFPELKDQLEPSVQQAQGTMNEAAESLREQQVQQGLDQERQALDQLGKLQQDMKQIVKKQRQGERDGARRSSPRDKVTIPGEDEERSGKQLRQRVMDAMKEEKLERYQPEIERYYKSIME